VSGHTPGPWCVEQLERFPWDISIVAADDEVLYLRRNAHSSKDRTLDDVMSCRHHGMGQDEAAEGNRRQLADARLIAAAPELLEALKAVVTPLAGGSFINLTGENAQAALAAIAKAEGKQP
jgi:hypothetical protein